MIRRQLYYNTTTIFIQYSSLLQPIHSMVPLLWCHNFLENLVMMLLHTQALCSRYLSLNLSLNSRRTVQDLFRRNSQLFPTPPTILTPRPSNALLNEGQDTEGRRGIRIDHTGELLSSTTFIHQIGRAHV